MAQFIIILIYIQLERIQGNYNIDLFMTNSLFKGFYRFSTFVENKAQFLYGINPIQLALAANRRKIQSIYLTDSQTVNPSYRITKIVNEAQGRKIPILFYPKDRMNRLVKDQPHQNIILKCSQLQAQENLSPSQYEQGIYVFCDKITDPQNMGAIIRSSLFFGVKTIFVSKKSSSPLNSTVSKASSGALQITKIHKVNRQQQFLNQWSKQKGLVISTSVSNQTAAPITPSQCREMIASNRQIYRRVLLILGSQGFGVSPHLARNSDVSLMVQRSGNKEYPYGLVDSLNVNSALSCILYQLTKL